MQEKSVQYSAENNNEMTAEEQRLRERLAKLDELEAAIASKEKELIQRQKNVKEMEKAKKQILLRLSPKLWEELAKWAEDDFRSINGQIEYLLADCVRKHRK